MENKAVMKRDEYGGLRTTTTIGLELGKWFAGATALEVLAAQQAAASPNDRSALLGFIPGFNRNVAIPVFGITSTVLYATSAVVKAAYKL